MRGVGGVDITPDNYMETDKRQVIDEYLKDLGQRVKSILPKEADLLVESAGNLGSKKIKNQVFIYSKLLSNHNIENDTIDFDFKYGKVTFRIPEEEHPFIQNLVVEYKPNNKPLAIKENKYKPPEGSTKVENLSAEIFNSAIGTFQNFLSYSSKEVWIESNKTVNITNMVL